MGISTSLPETPEEGRGPSLSPLRMSIDLRRKLGRGAHHNVRVLVRGDIGTGKTSLCRRLQSLPFVADLAPSRELEVAHVDWEPSDSADTVKCEVWDVVDADLSRRPAGLIADGVRPAPADDPGPADVWRGSHARGSGGA